MKAGRILAATVAMVAMAGLMSGCVVFKGAPTAKQIGKKPRVQVAFTICASGGAKSNCPDLGNAGQGFGPDSWRVLIGLRVPKGTKAPQKFRAVKVNGDGGTVRLARSPQYASELNSKAPKRKRFRYFGYISNPVDPDGTTNAARFKVKMRVPNSVVGKRFKVRPVVGAVQATAPAVDCGNDPFTTRGVFGSEGDGTICIDSPAPDAFRNIKVKIKR